MAAQKFKVGAKVWYADRTHGRRPAIVVEFEPKGKNGQDTYCVDCVDALGLSDEFEKAKWGYAHQISARS